jgi:RNA polymerase sigma-70 factor (ECF subfamily)
MSVATRTAPAPGTSCATPCAGLCTDSGFAAAHDEHRARLAAMARGLLADPDLAQDAVQEAFLRAWGACASFDPDSGPPLGAWLSVITRNVAIDMCRARAVRPRLPHTPPPEAPAEDGEALDAIDRATLRMVLLDALSGVSADHRGIVLRTVVHDRPYAEVAVELGLPVGTVKSRVFYALRDMRKRIDRPERSSPTPRRRP